MTTNLETDTQSAIDIATAAYDPKDLGGDGMFALPIPKDGSVVIVDVDQEAHQGYPGRKKGTVQVQDASTLVAYIGKHGLVGESEVWADNIGKKIVAVLNASDTSVAGWGDHRAEFTIQKTDAWKAWIENDGKKMDQLSFAEFLEDHLSDIHDPSAADMLAVAQSISGTVGVTFEQTRRLSTGEVQLEYRENVEAKADKARIEVPSEFVIAIRPFEGSAPYSMQVRFRYRISGGGIILSYKLVEPELRIDEAFAGVVADIDKHLEDYTVFTGIPAEPIRPNIPKAHVTTVHA